MSNKNDLKDRVIMLYLTPPSLQNPTKMIRKQGTKPIELAKAAPTIPILGINKKSKIRTATKAALTPPG
jgi:putative N-acetylmannosamine-6-phosphate epimerase